ncbi:MAG TPA: c-type cytochrome, partial [Micropepsaceae bacterium]|nr:c-type cytochrome [Micropepsaceae bacterium]
LNRVYLNIGLFSEEWLRHFNPVVGGKTISPIPIASAQKNSSYWQATEQGTPDTALFFLKSTVPDLLKEAPGGDKFLTDSPAVIDRGKTVFAETCARCHSSKGPEVPADRSIANCIGPNYLECFKRYWAYTQTADYKKQMNAIVHAPDFLDGNYLSTDARIPVTLLRTNACSPLATNGIRDNIWDNFTSDSYKNLPSVGTVTVYDPYTGEKTPYKMPAGGRGYTRPPSLIALWSSAPFLLNNSVGPFNQDPSVEGRMRAFDASIEQMLWPEKREHDSVLADKIPGRIDRTTARSYVYLPVGYLPDLLQPLANSFATNGSLLIGPIPQGTPIGLLANTKLRAEPGDSVPEHAANLAKLTGAMVLNAGALASANQTSDDELRQKLSGLREPFMALSKCPDFVVNRGHYFGSAMFNQQDGLSGDEKAFGTEPELNDNDKRALIAFLKTF